MVQDFSSGSVAVVALGGLQHRVRVGDVIRVHHLADQSAGSQITLDQVLLHIDGEGTVHVGQPVVSGVSATATVLENTSGEHLRVLKFKRRKGYKRTKGHRQELTVLRIDAIG